MTDTTAAEPQITKRHVLCRSAVIVAVNSDNDPVVQIHQSSDYIREDLLDAYLAKNRPLWQVVQVSDDYDAGPLGYHGPTYVDPALEHPLAGQFFPATPGSDAEAALLAAAAEAEAAAEADTQAEDVPDVAVDASAPLEPSEG